MDEKKALVQVSSSPLAMPLFPMRCQSCNKPISRAGQRVWSDWQAHPQSRVDTRFADKDTLVVVWRARHALLLQHGVVRNCCRRAVLFSVEHSNSHLLYRDLLERGRAEHEIPPDVACLDASNLWQTFMHWQHKHHERKYDLKCYFKEGEHGLIFAAINLALDNNVGRSKPVASFVCQHCGCEAKNQLMLGYARHMGLKSTGVLQWIVEGQFCSTACVYGYARHTAGCCPDKLWPLNVFMFTRAYGLKVSHLLAAHKHMLPRHQFPWFCVPSSENFSIEQYRARVAVPLRNPDPTKHEFASWPARAVLKVNKYAPGIEVQGDWLARLQKLLRHDCPHWYFAKDLSLPNAMPPPPPSPMPQPSPSPPPPPASPMAVTVPEVKADPAVELVREQLARFQLQMPPAPVSVVQDEDVLLPLRSNQEEDDVPELDEWDESAAYDHEVSKN